MRHGKRTFSLLVVAAWLMVLAGCGQKSNCSGITFSGSGSGGSGGTVNNSGGTVCGAGSSNGGNSATDFVYYLGSGTVIDAASLTRSTFANTVGYTPVGFPNGTIFGENFWIVNKQFLYVPLTPPGSPSGGAVSAFTITRSSAALTPVAGSPFVTSTTNADIAVSDPAGRFLFVADTGSGNIAAFQISATTGALTPAPGSPFQTNGAPNHMVVDGSGNYLYFPEGNFTYGFSIDQTTGALSPLFTSPFSVGMTALQAEPTGQYLLGVSATGITDVFVIPIGPGNGILGVPIPFPTVAAPENLAMHPSGKFLFTFAVDFTNQPLPLEGFTFDVTTATLTPMAGSPFSTLPKVVSGEFDQNGNSLIGVTGLSFTAYAIDSITGAPSNTIPSLAVPHDERFAVTN